MDPGVVIFSLVAQAYTQYSALDRLLAKSDSSARSQQRSNAARARMQMPDAPAHQAAAGARRQKMRGAADQLAAARAKHRAAAKAQQHAVSARRSSEQACAQACAERTSRSNKRARVAAHSVEQHRRLALTTSGPDAALWDQRFRDIRLEAERVRGVSHPWA